MANTASMTTENPTGKSSKKASSHHGLLPNRDDSKGDFLGTGGSSSQPAHDFAFYEWDFDNSSDKSYQANEDLNDARSPNTKSSDFHRKSIEDLMRPSIHRAYLAQTVGSTAALFNEMFDGIETDSFLSRDQTIDSRMDSDAATKQAHPSQDEQPHPSQDEQPHPSQDEQPPSRKGSVARRHTIGRSNNIEQPQPENARHRRWHSGRRRRRRSPEAATTTTTHGDSGKGLRGLLQRLSSGKKRK